MKTEQTAFFAQHEVDEIAEGHFSKLFTTLNGYLNASGDEFNANIANDISREVELLIRKRLVGIRD